MEFWNLLTQTALIGTDKKQLQSAELGEDLYPALQQLADASDLDAEERFLQTSALAFNYRQAGQEPLQVGEVPRSLAPDEELSYCNQQAKECLQELFHLESTGLLFFWIARCASKKQLVPPVLVPVLLQLATKYPEARHSILTVCGKRGEWLAGLNPAWQTSQTLSLEDNWQQGTTAQRTEALSAQRLLDPETARQWLSDTWATETVAVKQQLLKGMATGLSADDLPLLQQFSNDKSQKVKDALLELMRKIPESPIVQAYTTMVRSMLKIRKEKTLLGLSSKLVWEVLPAQEINPDWRKQGLEILSNRKEFTDDEFILFQLLAMVPPQVLTELSGLTPSELVEALQKEKRAHWLPAIATAAAQFQQREWINALAQQADQFYLELPPLLDAAKRDAYAKKHFKGNETRIIPACTQQEQEWSIEFAQLTLAYTAANPYQFYRSFYQEQAHLIPVTMLAFLNQVDTKVPYTMQVWEKNKELLHQLLDLKKRIQTAFN